MSSDLVIRTLYLKGMFLLVFDFIEVLKKFK
jgi:hypothetical protein